MMSRRRTDAGGVVITITAEQLGGLVEKLRASQAELATHVEVSTKLGEAADRIGELLETDQVEAAEEVFRTLWAEVLLEDSAFRHFFDHRAFRRAERPEESLSATVDMIHYTQELVTEPSEGVHRRAPGAGADEVEDP